LRLLALSLCFWALALLLLLLRRSIGFFHVSGSVIFALGATVELLRALRRGWWRWESG
jgi:hypothetical protein